MPQKKHSNALKGLVFGKHTVAGLILWEFELKKKIPRRPKRKTTAIFASWSLGTTVLIIEFGDTIRFH